MRFVVHSSILSFSLQCLTWASKQMTDSAERISKELLHLELLETNKVYGPKMSISKIPPSRTDLQFQRRHRIILLNVGDTWGQKCIYLQKLL